ncbi:MAG: glycosyltransferase family 8 protein [Treponemataceae bacterium]|nr:MAG: glycosyltransferase family 8 protein [Treponemataceae bacterium]
MSRCLAYFAFCCYTGLVMHIALCIDDNYPMQCGTFLKSIVITNPASAITFHIFFERLTQAHQDFLEKVIENTTAKIIFYRIDREKIAKIKSFPVRHDDHITLSTYYRLLLPALLPHDLAKIIYLDCDMLVLDSLEELWRTDIAAFSAGAVIDMFNDDIRIYNRLGYKRLGGYFNAGFLLINLEYWRTHQIAEKAMRFLFDEPEKCTAHDQDALNYAMWDSVTILPARYNIQADFFNTLDTLLIDKKHHISIAESLANPCIIHFTGATKPWHRECRHPYSFLWRKIQALTPWHDGPVMIHEYHGFRRFKYAVLRFLQKRSLVPDTCIYKADVREVIEQITEKITCST